MRKNPDPDYPLTPPVGRSGRPIGGGAGYSIAGVNEFDELIDDIYHFSESQGLEIDTLIHEEGAGQLEINLRHGDPIELADQVFMFKRTIREAALKHDTYATFMAKPIQGQPGSAMHIHQSVVDKKTGNNVFTAEDGTETDAFFHFIGGMQKHVPNALVMFAPYVNSYRRLTQAASAPVNNKWGYDNRTTAFRVPRSDPAARRVENRIPSSDANPYLALAASLACGLIGITNKIKPDAPVADHRQRGRDRPAARPARGRRPVRGGRGAARAARQHRSSATYAAIKRGRVRDLHGGDQPVGARVPAAQRLAQRSRRAMPYQSPRSRPAFPGTRTPPATRPDYPPLDGDRARRRRHRRRRLHRAVGGRPSRQGGRRRRADRGASLRRRRFGAQWRPARHRPARLARRAGRRDRLDARQGAVRPRRRGQGASRSNSPRSNGIDIDFMPGPALGRAQAALCRRLPQTCRLHARARFGYPHITFMDAEETAERLGSTHYFGGTRDTGTGHIHPLKLVIGTARVAAEAGAHLFENTRRDRHRVAAAARCR